MANAWKQFLDLIPTAKMLIGDVLSVDGDGMYSITLLGGGIVRVYSKETLIVDDRVFISGDQVLRKAPLLTAVSIVLPVI